MENLLYGFSLFLSSMSVISTVVALIFMRHRHHCSKQDDEDRVSAALIKLADSRTTEKEGGDSFYTLMEIGYAKTSISINNGGRHNDEHQARRFKKHLDGEVIERINLANREMFYNNY